MSEALSLHNASLEIVQMFEAACKELEAKGYQVTPEQLLAIRQRQATGEVWPSDPPITHAESPNRTVRVRLGDGSYMDQTFDRDKTPGLSPLDSAVRKLSSAAYAYNEEDYTACAILARQAMEEVAGALKDKSFMDVRVDIVEPRQIESGNG